MDVSKNLSETEKIKILQKEEKNRALFASIKDVLQLIDLTKSKNITYQTYSKDSLRTYLKNPASETNQKSLRKLSEYLYTVSHVYRRLILNKANQFDAKSYIVYPRLNDNGEVEDSTYQNYIKVTNYVQGMHLDTQIRKCLIKAFLDDIIFGFCYGNPEEDTFFIHILDPDYCKISSIDYYSGKINFAFDYTFFNSQNSFYLDIWDSSFKKAYNKYQNDNTLRWQEVEPTKSFCIKINDDNLAYPVPPFSGIFNSLIDLVDLSQIQALKDELSNSKLIWAKLDTLSGAKEVDDFEIDLQLAADFVAKIQESLPDAVTTALSPMDLNSIDLGGDTANDVDIVNRSLSTLIESNGDVVLNSNRISNSTSFKMAVKSDSMSAMAVVPQFNAFINFYVKNNLNVEDVIIEFSEVSKYFKDDKIDQLLKLAQYGIPVKSQIIALLNINPAQCRSLEYLESKMGLSTSVWINPLVSSNVQSGSSKNGDGSDGRPEKEDGELSDQGESSRDKDTNQK